MKALAIMCGLVCCGLIGCSNHSSRTLPAEVTRAFEEAVGTDDPAKAGELFTEDAEILTQERPVVKGREEIKQYLADQMNPMILFDTTTEMSVVRGDIALETGKYTFRDTRRGADIEYGKYMTVWRKDGDHWKIFRTMFNTDEPTGTRVSVAHDDAAPGSG